MHLHLIAEYVIMAVVDVLKFELAHWCFLSWFNKLLCHCSSNFSSDLPCLVWQLLLRCKAGVEYGAARVLRRDLGCRQVQRVVADVMPLCLSSIPVLVDYSSSEER